MKIKKIIEWPKCFALASQTGVNE